jgi:serine/threonine protein kinase
LKALKATGLCHRNLSLDAIAMDGDHFDIIGLGWTIRVTDGNISSSSSSSSSSRVMVRAAGLMLYSMVVGTNALFSTPIAGDKIFTRLCIKGDIRGEVERYGKQLGRDYYNLLSNDLLDLLRTMLSADPKQRLSLEEVMEHPWVTNDDLIITPTQWMEKKKKSII